MIMCVLFPLGFNADQATAIDSNSVPTENHFVEHLRSMLNASQWGALTVESNMKY